MLTLSLLLYIIIYYMAHGVELRFRLLPFLFFNTILQQSATSIQPIAIGKELHAAQGYKEVGLPV